MSKKLVLFAAVLAVALVFAFVTRTTSSADAAGSECYSSDKGPATPTICQSPRGSASPRQRVSDDVIAGLCPERAMPAGDDHHILPPVAPLVTHRRRLPARRQAVLP